MEAVVEQKNSEIEAIRAAMMEREAAAKEAMTSMQVRDSYFYRSSFSLRTSFLQKAHEELRQNQVLAQKETIAQIERLKVGSIVMIVIVTVNAD